MASILLEKIDQAHQALGQNEVKYIHKYHEEGCVFYDWEEIFPTLLARWPGSVF